MERYEPGTSKAGNNERGHTLIVDQVLDRTETALLGTVDDKPTFLQWTIPNPNL